MEVIRTGPNGTDVVESVAFHADELGFGESWSFRSADGRTENR